MIDQTNWFALLTRSNFEQTVYNSILKKKIPVFLPTIKKKSKRKDRSLMIEVPLFPGYIFVESTLLPADQLNILKTTGAVRLLGTQSTPVPVPDVHIESLRILVNSDADLITGTSVNLESGDPVVILEGPMAGVRGEFTRYKGHGRVVIKVDALSQYVGVEVEEDNIEKVPGLLA